MTYKKSIKKSKKESDVYYGSEQKREKEYIEKGHRFRNREIKPLNDKQESYFKAIENNQLTVVTGCAGTGKSFIASIIASDMFNAGELDSIILCRPTEGPGKHIGTLPGTVNEKLEAWLTPLVSTIRKRLGPGSFDYNLNKGNIEFLSLNQVKGRSFDDAFVIIDEAEDIDVDTMKSLVTRIGNNTKVVIDGDIKQKHIRQESGLGWLVYLIHKYNLPVPLIEFDVEDCVRGSITKMFLQVFEREEEEKNEK